MKIRGKDAALVVVTTIPIVLGAVLAAISIGTPAPRNLEEISSKMRAGEFDVALRELGVYLRENSGDDRAKLMTAQAIIERVEAVKKKDESKSNVKYESECNRALKYLESTRFKDSKRRAEVALWKGKAMYHSGRWGRAEVYWKEALDLDPRIPEAGWALLDLYYVEYREDEAHDLAMRLYKVEPDPRDRANLLLELIRREAQLPDPESIVNMLKEIVLIDPDDLHAQLALGLAYVKNSRLETGLGILREAERKHPDRVEVWDVSLTALEIADPDGLAAALNRMPERFRSDPRFAYFYGRVAQDKLDWKTAIVEYRRAWETRPYDSRLAYRLSRALRLMGNDDESRSFAKQFEGRIGAIESARKQIRDIYVEATSTPNLGIVNRPSIYEKLASLRERMGRDDEAALWREMSAKISANAAGEVEQKSKPASKTLKSMNFAL
jgi:tetratricopeptide (TPR) repeat protein